MAGGLTALARWRGQLEGWAIPEEILRAAPESPWSFPAEPFRRRAEAPPGDTPSLRRAREVVSQGATVLDVGAGAGAASLPLAPPAALIVAVDSSPDMLAAFRDLAERRGVEARTIQGPWPDVAAEAPEADVVVCHHVLYNAPDLAAFAGALTGHARRRVVVEITDRHPLAWAGPLWRRFHGLERPSGPTADDAMAALAEAGIEAHREDFDAPDRLAGFERREDVIAFVRRRLCVTAELDPEVTEAIAPHLVQRDGVWAVRPPDRRLVTLWWEP